MKYEIIDWVNKPTDEKLVKRYERKALKSAEAFHKACAECIERWNKEIEEKKELDETYDVFEHLQNRFNGMIEHCIRHVPVFWNIDIRVEYKWRVDEHLNFVMTIEEPDLDGDRKIVVKINED